MILPLNESRIDFYMGSLKFNLEHLFESSKEFQDLASKHETEYNIMFEDLVFLTNDGQIYQETVTFKHAINLFISYADSVTINDLVKESPPLNVSSYAVASNAMEGPLNLEKSFNHTYQVRILQRSLYFLF